MDYCMTCMLSDKGQKICRLSNRRIDLDTDYCSKHTAELVHCELCHNLTMPNQIIYDIDMNGKEHGVCGGCAKSLGTCESCNRIQTCLFETDPDPMPKVVVKTIQQGNMTMQTQCRNEEREKKFCHTCPCWNKECGCLKQFNMGCNKKIDFWTGREICNES